jgi:phosphoribosyl 1,2-cyclic phosphodiesterase
MKIRFWGVRGSIPSPGPGTVRYGGNTTCIEVNGDDGTLIVMDCGTGIRPLGESLMKKPLPVINIFITHTHWDHIHGFPFFIPAYIPTSTINIFGPPQYNKSLGQIMSQQMQYSYFPVRADELKSSVKYTDIKEETREVGAFTVKSALMNHPVTCYAYRIEEKGGRSMLYTGDHEPYYNFLNAEIDAGGRTPGDDTDREENDMIIKEQNDRTVRFAAGVDVLISDSQYLEEEYPSKKGWGHSSIYQSIDLAVKAKVKHLVLFHHEPTRSDDAMDKLLETAITRGAAIGHPELKITAAMEGEEIVL